jgi:hypothetical protein
LPGVEPLIVHAVPFALVVTRMMGLFVFAPMLTSLSIPTQVRVLLACMLAAAVYPSIPLTYAETPMTLFGLAPLLVSETLIGVCVGVIASIPVMILQLGGHVTGFQMGLSIATVYNPDFDTNSDVVGETLFYLGFAVFLAVGGLEATYAALLTTFERVPLGGMAGELPRAGERRVRDGAAGERAGDGGRVPRAGRDGLCDEDHAPDRRDERGVRGEDRGRPARDRDGAAGDRQRGGR